SARFGVAGAAIHLPEGEQAGKIQLRMKSAERLWKCQSGGPDTRTWSPLLGCPLLPPENARSGPHHVMKSAYGSNGLNTFIQFPPPAGATSRGPEGPFRRAQNSNHLPSGDHPATAGVACVPDEAR